MKPLALDLCCGLGGWAEGLMAAGWNVLGIDNDPRFIGRYPGRLVLADILTFSVAERARRRFSLVVASPPCTEPSYRAMPWKRAKALNAAGPPHTFIALFNACFRIAGEIGCPIIVENVKGAQPWVGRAKWHYGSFYLWGDVPALMPVTRHAKHGGKGGSWFAISHGKNSGGMYGTNPVRGVAIGEGIKQHGSGSACPHWRMQKESGIKVHGQKHGAEYAFTRGRGGINHAGIKVPKHDRNGDDWFDGGAACFSSKSDARREASALIAKIPFELSRYIGQVFYPGTERVA